MLPTEPVTNNNDDNNNKHKSSVQRAIMEVLFKPVEEKLSAGMVAAAADASRAGGGDTMEGVFGGALAIRRRWESKKDESKAFSCTLWCTIALGAMTSNLNIRTVSVGLRNVWTMYALQYVPTARVTQR